MFNVIVISYHICNLASYFRVFIFVLHFFTGVVYNITIGDIVILRYSFN